MSATTTLSTRIQNARDYIEKNFNPLSEGNYSHFYTGRISRWDDEYSPDISTSAESELTETKLERIFMKQMTTDNSSLAIKRFDWISGTKYTRADYNVEYTDYRNWLHPEQPFYIINSEGNVYKCIANNNNGESLVEPTGQSVDYLYLGDGYTWKFMYDILSSISTDFLTDTWIPLPDDVANKTTSHTDVESNAVIGDIANIVVNDVGDGYTSPPVIQIRGDGVGAEATAIMIGESIDYIQLTNNGTGYTVAEVFIFGTGSGADATAMISPPLGHGADAVYELGAFYVEMFGSIIGTEDGFAPITGTYRNVGIVRNTINKASDIITDEKLNTLSDINISNCSGDYQSGELVIGEDSRSQGIVYYDPTGIDKDIQLLYVTGSFIDQELIHGQITGIHGTFEEGSSTYTDVDIWSGEILYKEHIVFITRREIQTEKFVFTIEF